jgi:hypothetical protein
VLLQDDELGLKAVCLAHYKEPLDKQGEVLVAGEAAAGEQAAATQQLPPPQLPLPPPQQQQVPLTGAETGDFAVAPAVEALSSGHSGPGGLGLSGSVVVTAAAVGGAEVGAATATGAGAVDQGQETQPAAAAGEGDVAAAEEDSKGKVGTLRLWSGFAVLKLWDFRSGLSLHLRLSCRGRGGAIALSCWILVNLSA